MSKKAKILSQEKIYKGYLQFNKYDLEIPSLDSNKESLSFKNREIVHSSDSVLILIYAPLSDSFVFCQQFREGVFFNRSQDDPFILECVAGTIEKNAKPEETARREVYEETGLKVESLKPIAIAYKSPGILTEKMYSYYAEIEGKPESGFYGIEDEEILTQIIERKTVYQLMDEMKINDSATLVALNWFRANHNT